MGLLLTFLDQKQRARARVYMYGALLNLLKISSGHTLKHESEDILMSYGEKILHVISTDAMTGHAVARVITTLTEPGQTSPILYLNLSRTSVYCH